MSGFDNLYTFYYRAQQCSGFGTSDLEQLYLDLIEPLRDINVAPATLTDIINACDALTAKPQMSPWRKARYHEIRAPATLLLARTSQTGGLIDDARQHYRSARPLYTAAHNHYMRRIDNDLLPQCDVVEQSGEVPWSFVLPGDAGDHDYDQTQRLGSNTEEAMSQTALQRDPANNNVQTMVPAAPQGFGKLRGPSYSPLTSPPQGTGDNQEAASTGRPEASYDNLVKQCFDQNPNATLTVQNLHNYVVERTTTNDDEASIKGAIKRILGSHTELYVKAGLRTWQLTAEARAALETANMVI